MGVVLAVAVVGGYFFIGRGGNLGSTFTVTRGEFREQVRVSGTVTAAEDADLGFAASGRIIGTYASVGQHVSRGTVLAEIENGDLLAVLSQKRSALARAEADLASLRTGTRPEEIALAETAVTSAQAALVNAIQNAYTTADDAVRNRIDTFFVNPRTSPKLSFTVANANLENAVERDRAAAEPLLLQWALLVSGLTSGNAVDVAGQAQANAAQVSRLLADAGLALNQAVPDQTVSAATLTTYSTSLATARTAMNAAITTLTASVSALETAKSTLLLKQAGPTSDAIAAQEAVVAGARADVQSAGATLGKTRVLAPFSGTVTRMDARIGEVTSPTESQISIQGDGLFQIETYVPEVAISRIVPGNPATTTLDAYGPSVEFGAIVVAVDPAETMKDGIPTYKTTLAFLSADDRIRSGMTTDVIIETGVLRDAVVIPSGAVEAGHTVSVVSNGVVEKRPVTLGPSPALGQAHILSGLSAGDVILLTPAQ
jgi:HlyD family secretion protein